MADPVSALIQLPSCSVNSSLPAARTLPAAADCRPPGRAHQSAQQHNMMFCRQCWGACLEVGVVKLQPLNGPGGAPGGAWPILCVLSLVLAKARPGGLGTAQGVGTCSQQEGRATVGQL